MSLVEPLVAMVVIAFSLLGSVGMFAVAQDGISVGAKKLEAAALVESKMERLRTVSYRNLLDGEQRVNGMVLTWTVRPDRLTLAESRSAVIEVAAEWMNQKGQPRAIRLNLRKANPVFASGVTL